MLTQYRGGSCQVAVQFHGAGARGTFSFGAEWNVRPTPALIEELETLLGRGRIAVLYSPPPVAPASLRSTAEVVGTFLIC